jgi:hypothetical protein
MPPHQFAGQMNLSNCELIDELRHLCCDYVRFPVSPTDTGTGPSCWRVQEMSDATAVLA